MKNKKPALIKAKSLPGFYTTKERSVLMAKIKSKETKAEIMFRKALWVKGIRYRKHLRKLPGNPDIVINKLKIVIFIDGEFWHGHDWEIKKTKIKANRAYWLPKIERNMQRDKENTEKLELMGYKVFRFWEHEIKKNISECMSSILGCVSANK
ncbi:MAG TPA: very short patch repair endonuclease [Bacteroidia bacterium]|nr:very short patch repair endonuclease [Bacteroidia bacterium]